jgi:DNA-binding response OmpR family regulator
MRGTVLLLNTSGSPLADVDLLRANGLIVHHCRELPKALHQLEQQPTDVIFVVSDRSSSESTITQLRDRADHATSIIVASAPGERDAVRSAGADSFLSSTVKPADVLYEIHRALILRRSGRRLSWG